MAGRKVFLNMGKPKETILGMPTTIFGYQTSKTIGGR
jgi:hypothetical protein